MSLGFLFLIVPALAAQTDKPTEKTAPETSAADPNAIASPPQGGTDITELLAEDKKNIAKKASDEQSREIKGSGTLKRQLRAEN